jgi:hypothetical protein
MICVIFSDTVPCISPSTILEVVNDLIGGGTEATSSINVIVTQATPTLSAQLVTSEMSTQEAEQNQVPEQVDAGKVKI